jgi:hypothetical protein
MPFNFGSINGVGAPDERNNPLLALASTIAQIPQQIQAGKQQKQQNELNSLQVLAQKQQMGQQALSQFAQRGQSDPKLLADPDFTAQAIAAAKPFGYSVPLIDGPNGSKVLDVAALTPNRDYRTAAAQNPDIATKLLALPKGPDRAAAATQYTNVPQELLDAEQYVPLSSGAQTALGKETAIQVDKLGKGDLNPREFAGYIRANYANLKASGENPDFYLSEAFQKDTASQLAQAQIARMQALGVHLKNADALAQKLEQDHLYEFGVSNATKRRGQDIQASLGAQRIGIAAQNAQTSIGRLSVAEGQLDIATKNYMLNNTKFTAAQVSNTYNAFKGEYDAAQRAVDDASKSLANSVSGADPNAIKKLTDQIDPAVKGSPAQRLLELQPKLQAARNLVEGQPGRTFQQVTGKPARLLDDESVRSAEYGQGRGVPDAAGYTFTGDTTTGKNGETLYRVRGANGRTRLWKPD